MKNAPNPDRDRADAKGSFSESDRTRETPSADMQAEDAGTAASGSTTPAEPAMKQTSKTPHERGERR